jgi:hypothetical protein
LILSISVNFFLRLLSVLGVWFGALNVSGGKARRVTAMCCRPSQVLFAQFVGQLLT